MKFNPVHLLHRLMIRWDASYIVWSMMEFPRPSRLNVFLTVWAVWGSK